LRHRARRNHPRLVLLRDGDEQRRLEKSATVLTDSTDR